MSRVKRLCSIDRCGRPHVGKSFCNMHYLRYKKYGSPAVTKCTPTGEPMKFLEKAIKANTNDCIEWVFGRNRGNYGLVRYGGRFRKATEVSLILTVGNKPKNKPQVLHSCHNPPCVNPKHLRYGTAKENRADAVKAGRIPRGESNPKSKLTEAKARSILLDERICKDIAKDYGVSRQTVQSIKDRNSWAWL